MRAAALVAVMAAMTILLRFLPFLIFRSGTPKYIAYLGKVLPSAVIGMLVIYCLKDVSFVSAPFALPELIASVCVVVIQARSRSSLLSILAGTAVYMILLRAVF